MISIVLPIGPEPRHQMYLRECIESIRAQTMKPAATVVVDDMAKADPFILQEAPNLMIHRNPWRLGIPASFNVGVAVAPTQCVLMLGADDTLDPTCVERCWYAYNHHQDPDARYYYLGVKYMDTGEEQFLACNAAMVTKTLWRQLGGFPPQSAVGACDTMLLSIMTGNEHAGILTPVSETQTLYNYRRHDESETAHLSDWQEVIFRTRHILTRDWNPPNWGRYE